MSEADKLQPTAITDAPDIGKAFDRTQLGTDALLDLVGDPCPPGYEKCEKRPSPAYGPGYGE